MDQNQTVDNDLQKAIDDITNTTSADPVFSDPVAAPSSVPEGDTGELSEPVGPFPEPEEEPKIEMVPPAPEPIAPLDPISIPDLSMPPLEQAPSPEPKISKNSPASEMPLPDIAPAEKMNTQQIKNAALRDLAPLLDRVEMSPSQKFNIYRNIFEDLRDYTILESAYKVAREIPDETERAKALLYLVESIDKM